MAQQEVAMIGIVGGTVMIVFGFGMFVGSHYPALLIYVIAAMATSYLLPIIASLVRPSQKLVWFFIPIVTSVIFALPSSVVYDTGCKAGHTEAAWAMRAVPVIGLLELATPINLGDDCKRLRGPS